jgi:ArsR family transcriptional regulator
MTGASIAPPIDTRQYLGQTGRMTETLPAQDGVCCPPVLRAPLGGEEAAQLAAAFKVLADPARLRLLSLIAAHEGGEACTCELTGPLGLTQPTVSHHLKVLHAAGLLERRRGGSYTYYRILPQRLGLLSAALRPASAP